MSHLVAQPTTDRKYTINTYVDIYIYKIRSSGTVVECGVADLVQGKGCGLGIRGSSRQACRHRRWSEGDSMRNPVQRAEGYPKKMKEVPSSPRQGRAAYGMGCPAQNAEICPQERMGELGSTRRYTMELA